MSSKPLKLLLRSIILISTLSTLSGCAHGSTVPVLAVSDYCRIAKPIGYDATKDTAETVAAIEAHNSAWVCVCEHDCPKPAI